MRKLTYECDGKECNSITTNPENEWLEIKSESDNELTIVNGLPDKRLISLSRYTALHFCSSKCFIDYFIMKPDVES